MGRSHPDQTEKTASDQPSLEERIQLARMGIASLKDTRNYLETERKKYFDNDVPPILDSDINRITTIRIPFLVRRLGGLTAALNRQNG